VAAAGSAAPGRAPSGGPAAPGRPSPGAPADADRSVGAGPQLEGVPPERLLGIGEAAARSGVSERALRYYQQLGLITPSGRTPGGLRRYSADDLARVGRLRELQDLLGLNLEEIRSVFDNEDRLAELRREYRAEHTDAARRRELIAEGLDLRRVLAGTVEAKIAALQRFLADLDAERTRLERILADGSVPAPA
jgi:DNA-binding transcriptional MerR regulator